METTHFQRQFLKLFLAYEKNLRAFTRSIVPNMDDVDEIIQEASITMLNKFEDLQNEEGFLPWAIVTCRYTALNHMRKKRRDRHIFDDEILDLLSTDASERDSETPKKSLIALRQCIKKLDQYQQQIVLAPYKQNDSLVKLAEQKGVSVNSLYKKVGRLRDKLGKCVRENSPNIALNGAN